MVISLRTAGSNYYYYYFYTHFGSNYFLLKLFTIYQSFFSRKNLAPKKFKWSFHNVTYKAGFERKVNEKELIMTLARIYSSAQKRQKRIMKGNSLPFWFWYLWSTGFDRVLKITDRPQKKSENVTVGEVN